MAIDQAYRSRGSSPARNQLLAVLVAAVAIIAGVAVPAAGAVVPFKAVVTLTPATSTLGSTITAAVNRSTKPAGDSLRKIGLNWGDGSKAISLASPSSRPTHRYGHPGAFTVRLTLVDRHGKVAHGSAVEHVTAPAGSYTGLASIGLRFFVSFGSARVQDVSDFLLLNCSNSTALDDTLIVPAATITAAGAFAASRTDTGILNGQSATFAYHFAGRLTWSTTSGVRAAGTMRETISFPDSGVTCTTNTLAWAAERDTQPAQHNTAPPAGSYTGLSPHFGLRFFVSFSRTLVQDVSELVQLTCSNGVPVGDTVIVPAATISTTGAFAASRTDTGILNGQSADYSYLFRGNFHSLGADSAFRAAGTMRETISFPDSGVTCTTDSVAWTAERDTQPAQHNTAPPAGSYTGLASIGLRFFVSFGHTRVQDVSDFVLLNCSNNTALDDTLIVPTATITAAGAFAASRTDTGILNGQSADYSYLFRGNFHSLAADGAFRAAGTMRETISFPDSGVTCTTNTLAWAAERDTQPAQHNTPPPTGSYTGLSAHVGLTYTVASSTSMQNVSEFLLLNCSDNTAIDDTLIVPAAIISTTGAFAASNTDTGILGGHPTDFTYTFRGNFHSTGPDGAERAAGTMRESLVFTDTDVTCTTNTLAWAAERTG